jgi:Mrp family chromosome partitioning ATPase
MVTSAAKREGRSTTVANLAVALTRAGRRVILVDLDLRRPALEAFFSKPGIRPGVTDIVLGRVELKHALTPIAIASREAERRVAANGGASAKNGAAAHGRAARGSKRNGHVAGVGELYVLPSGPVPEDIGEFVGSEELADLLAKLRRRADIVLVDAPPLLGTGDAIALSGHVDGLLVVARLNDLRRPSLAELRRVLDTCPAEKLGFVLTDADLDEDDAAAAYADHAQVRQPEAVR